MVFVQVLWDGYGCDVNGNTWKVPEGVGANNNNVKVKEEMGWKQEMGWKLGQREASLLRYKEKRQSRLFAKRIRYEVRKLNAEKRPRMKVLLLTSTASCNYVEFSVFNSISSCI